VRTTHPWWRVRRSWPADDSRDVLMGERLASKLGKQPGDTIEIAAESHRVVGILSTGGAEDDQIVASLAVASRCWANRMRCAGFT